VVVTPAKPAVVCLTVDLEPDCPPYLWTWRGMSEGLPRLLELFALERIPVTFFTTGDAAQRHPTLIERLVDAGHELGCHGMTHMPFPSFDRQRARWEIEESSRILRDFGPVTSFRAPYLRFPDAFLDLLEEAGFTLDSSQAKYKRAGFARSTPTTLVRIPASVTSSVLRLPAWIRDPWLRSLASPAVLFAHPWEFVDLTRERLRLDCRFRTGEPALSDLRAVIRLFKSRGAEFARMDTLAAQPGMEHGR